MFRTRHPGVRTWFFVLIAVALSCGAYVAEETPAQEEDVNVTVVVREAETGDPIAQARLTLTFERPGHGFHRSKTISYNAKTGLQGRYRFTDVPKGTVHLSVTAERRQSYGKEIELEEDGQIIEVKLKKPQAIL